MNQQLSIYVLEDVAEAAEFLCSMLRSSALIHNHTVDRVASLEALEALVNTKGAPDIALIDIVLDGETNTGIDAVRRLFPKGSRTQIIYTSGHLEFVSDVYTTEHIGFLPKPYDQANLDAALVRALEGINAYEASLSTPFAVKNGSTLVMVDPATVMYVESFRNIIVFETTTGQIRAAGPLGSLVNIVPDSIVRCHKSFFVNFSFIKRMTSISVVMVNGREIPLGRRWRDETRASFMQYLHKRSRMLR